MRYLAIVTALIVLLTSSLACCSLTQIPGLKPPDIQIPDVELPKITIPTLQVVAETIEKHEAIAVGDITEATVQIILGAGDLAIHAGDPGNLLSADFSYNVEEWAPEVDYDAGEQVLSVKQGGGKASRGLPSDPNIRNAWDLGLSPTVPLTMNLIIGAGQGDLDLTGLQIARLDANLGAGDFLIHFDTPSPTALNQMTVRTGASRVRLEGIGNASPEHVVVQGGAGDITLDLGGAWQRSADVKITAGVGQVTLRIPSDISARMRIDGLATIENGGLRKLDDNYVSDAYDDTEPTVDVHITAGIGNIRLEQVAN